MEPRIIVDTMDQTGEGPLWHPIERKLYWGDITRGLLYRLDPSSGKHELVVEADEMFGGYTFQVDGSILMFLESGKVASLKDGKLETLIDCLPGEEQNRFNDVIADPEGRVFCGTMCKDSAAAMDGTSLGTLYRMDTDGSITVVEDNVAISNGIGFTPDLTGMYYVDSPTGSIFLYDYDRSTGSVSNKRVYRQATEQDGLPDGMTVDADGYVWSARVITGELHRYSPSGEKVLSIDFPCNMVSSVIFGGNEYQDIYVTTIGGDDRSTHGEGAGALFHLDVNVKGRPDFLSNVKC